MKKSSRARLLTFVLALCLCTTMVTPAFAAGGRHSSSSGSRWSFSSWWNGWWNRGDDNTSNSDKSDTSSEPELKLVEDQSTVAEGTELRASTYAVESDDDAAANGTTDVKYFPVTMYNYDTAKINTATHNAEAAQANKENKDSIDTWEGIYFSSGNPIKGSGTYDKAAYLGDNTGTVKLSESTTSYEPVEVYYAQNNRYTNYTSGGYYTDKKGTEEVTRITCTRSYDRWNQTYTYTWTINGESLGSSSSNLITLYKKTTTDSKTYTSTTYANWNKWGGNVTNATGNYIYSGLVEDKLDKTNNIVFTKTEPGLFRSDDTTNNYGKTIYTNVGLPFQYDKTTKYYTFNSNKMSAHFTSDNKAGSNKNLTYGTTAQTISDLNVQGKKDGDQSSWLPFDEETSVTTSEATYHFGMQATIPFSMTANGRMNANDNNSDAIKFDFSGDDDVWVFVDGKLVLDIGGIHNEMAGSMNFAENTWSVVKSSDNGNTNTVGDMNGQKMEGKLFNDDDGTGVLNTDRTTFAMTTSHTLTVFYLERGAGASNCKISFNLPMQDSVSVKKVVSDKDSENIKLSEDVQNSINKQEFTFKLFKNGNPVANTNYIILDESNQPIGTATTTGNGTFKLKNKQTAKFVGQIQENGNTYYVEEVKDDDDGWITPDSSYTAVAAGKATETEQKDGTTSAKVKMIGSDEANDHLDYTFTNTLTHVDNVDIRPQDDRIVIDYGLPVKIDPLANDVVQNATMSLEKVEGAEFGTATTDGDKIIYQLNKQLTDVETLTYTVKANPTNNVGEAQTKTAKIYIIPATSMYYEENFSDNAKNDDDKMMKFSASWGPANDTATTPYQEPGVVGTTDDSPYGSDNAYMDSTGDSCGTSMYVNTAEQAKTFKYTFTGMGTSFFARTTNNSGFMRVTIYDENNEKLDTFYRNTLYKTDDKNTTLYNIPVFTWDADEYGYGTYTVAVTVARQNNAGTYGTDFWVDGVRVMNPLNPDAEKANWDIAQDAYAADGESGMKFATLRDALLADATEDEDSGELIWDTSKGFVVFTDSNGSITKASEYQSDGPKEEVYLAKDQSVSFSLTNWNPDTNHLYLGIKAPMGSGTVRFGNGESIEVKNTVDCYYDVAKFATITEVDGRKVATLTITNPEDAIISLTNIKVTGDPDFVIVPGKDTNGDDETDPDEEISAGESTDESPESEDADVIAEE